MYQTPYGRLDFSRPLVMGILNITPDSFYSKSRVGDEKLLVERVGEMLAEGADMIDVGGASTRPGSSEPTEKEELNRIVPSIKILRKNFPNLLIAVDTYRANVAHAAYEEGVDIINDISGGAFDQDMISLISRINIPYIVMHLRGTRETMHQVHSYDDVVRDVFMYFEEKINLLNASGIHQIILDPGFGFSKQLEDNYKLLGAISTYKEKLNYPILVGISRKRMIQQVVGTDADHALNGTTAAHVIALMNGASILRVHDVKEAKEAIKITQYFLNVNKISDILHQN